LRPAAPTLAESKVTAQAGDGGGTPAMMDDAQKTVLVQAEVKRMKGLPATSSYATHRLKVLDKMLQLLSKVREGAVDDEHSWFCGISVSLLVFGFVAWESSVAVLLHTYCYRFFNISLCKLFIDDHLWRRPRVCLFSSHSREFNVKHN